MFPVMKHIPSWFPGAGWKRRAEYYKRINELVAREPFEIVRQNLVRCFCFSYIYILLILLAQRNGTAAPSIAASLIEALPDENTAERNEEEQIAVSTAATAFIGKETTHPNIV